ARSTHNPADYSVDTTRVNPWNDPRVSDEDGVRYSLESSTLCGTPERVAEGLAALRDAGIQHVLCQMSYGYMPHASIIESMRRFGEKVIPRFRCVGFRRRWSGRATGRRSRQGPVTPCAWADLRLCVRWTGRSRR